MDRIKSIEQPKEESLQISGELYQGLKQFVKDQRITLNTAVQFSWHKLIQTYTRDNQTVVGTTVSGRNIPIAGIESSVGLYINTLPLIINWQEHNQDTIAEQLKHIHQQITELNNYSHANLAELQQQGRRLFHSLLVFENYPEAAEKIGEGETKHRQTKINLRFRGSVEKLDYPLSIIAYENSQGLTIKFKYAGEFVAGDKIVRLLNQLRLILQQLLNANNKISDISLLTQEEYQQLVYDYNQTDKQYPKDKTIHQLFEEQVKKTPNNIAVIFEDNKLTYKELNARANQLARYMREQYKQLTQEEIKSDALIALCLDRSHEMIIAILAVLKSGGAYVPIDPSYPSERINYILQDTNTGIVITQEHLQKQLKTRVKQSQRLIENQSALENKKIKFIVIDSEQTQQALKKLQKSDLKKISTATDLAYVIYTSGTTGRPKGVLQLHSNVMRLFASTDEYFKFSDKDTWTFFHSYTFDFTVWELWGALTYGGKLVIPSYSATRDTNEFYKLCGKYNVSILSQTPAAFYQFIEVNEKQNKEKLSSLRYVVFGGDVLNIQQLKKWLIKYGDQQPKLINMYGITETTVHVTLKEISEKDLLNNHQSIGKPLADLTAYILDSNLIPVPVGVTGELYIGGAGLARGYLNHPELTAARFIANPFATEADKAKGYTRLYKTGDLAKWLPDGNIEYIGRNDFQVKIRGFRIELGEIEDALSKINGIKQVTVQAKDKQTEAGTTKYLVAYYVKGSQAQITQEKIISHLSQSLPDYMIPRAFIELEKFPLTINGKLDRKALPEPEFTNQDSYVAPTSELEQQLCEIWQEVLVISRVSITDDFFRIGGDSILSILLSSKMRKVGHHLSVKDIFEHRTISSISRLLKEQQAITSLQTEQGVLEGEFDLLPIQDWFFDKVKSKECSSPNHWNQSFIVKVPELDIDKLQSIIPALVEQHDILRANYKKDLSGKYIQNYNAHINIPALKILDITKVTDPEKIHQILTNWQNNFDIEKGSLWQIGYIPMENRFSGMLSNNLKIFGQQCF